MKSFTLLALFLLPFFALAQAPDSAAVVRQVDSLVLAANNLSRQGDDTGALEAFAAAEKLTLDKFGRKSAGYAIYCMAKGDFHYWRAEYPAAEKCALEAKLIHEGTLGKQHPEYARALRMLGDISWYAKGDFNNAELLLLEAVAFQEKTWGNAHPKYAGSLVNLATMYSYKGNYLKSEAIYLQARSVFEDKLEDLSLPAYRGFLHNFAILYYQMGDYEKSIELNQQLLKIIEKTGGNYLGHYANVLYNLSTSYLGMERYEIAEPLMLEAKALYEKTLGKEHPKYAEVLYGLANTYYEGNSNEEKAEQYFLETLAIAEKTLGKESQDYCNYLSGLALVYIEKGEFEKGEPLLIEVLGINEKTVGKEHFLYALNLAEFASLLAKKGDKEKARQLWQESLSIMEKAEGRKSIYYADKLSQLAQFYNTSGEMEKAEACLAEAKSILEKTSGKVSPSYARCIQELATFYLQAGNAAAAAPLLAELPEVQKSLLVKGAKYLSENEMRSYSRTFENSLDLHLSFAQAATQPGFTGSSFDNTLFHKGFLLQASNQIRKLAEGDTTLAKLKSSHRRLAAAYALPMQERDSAYVAELEEKASQFEKELARTVAGYGDAFRQVKWQEVQATLQPGEAAVEFVRYRFSNPHPTDSILYAALVLLPGAAQPAFVPLFEEKQLDSLLLTNGERRADYVSNLYSSNERGATALGKPQRSLYELLWQPLEQVLNSPLGVGGTVYFSPTGLLHRLNLGAIPTQAETVEGFGEILADRYRLVELGSTRQLAIPSERKSTGNQALLFGAIQYEMDSVAIASANYSTDDEMLADRSRGLSLNGGVSFSNADSTLRGGTWNYLRWTEKEVNSLGQIMKNSRVEDKALKGHAATEEAFKSIGRDEPSPRILHVATHGFFFPDPTPQPPKGGAGAGPPSGVGGEPVFKMSDHPMIRSGLILAGANHAWQNGKPFKPGMEDGILTAYEISQMNLSNTELVVLSACETGLGDIRGNEGVYGLQRAFKIAGAKQLLMSLWQVPDFQTQELMTLFYKNWLQEKMTVRDALKAAQDELRRRGLEPFYWAGFVLVE